MLRKSLKYFLVVVVALVLVVGLGYAAGIFGVPTVESVDNRFGDVNESTTTIETDLTVNNPNPIGITVGDLRIDYDIVMNDIRMATGSTAGLSLDRGNSTIELTTYLDNQQIPDWWTSHIQSGERTELVINADVSHGLLGSSSHEVGTEREIETDILDGLNSTEPEPINADQPLIDDPVLYLNETEGWFGEDVTQERTPLEKEFTFYNPKPWPYTITEIGYTIEMNNITVGEGATEQATVIPGGMTETIEAETDIRNERLDQWWVSHIERNEVTDLYIDFYIIVDPDPTGLTDIEPFRIDADELDHETTIETDIFGTKEQADHNSQTDDGDEHDDTGEGDDGDDDESNGETGDESGSEDGDESDGDGETDSDGDGDGDDGSEDSDGNGDDGSDDGETDGDDNGDDDGLLDDDDGLLGDDEEEDN